MADLGISLYIDDERPTPTGFTHSAKTAAAAIAILEDARAHGAQMDLISFDHDLGDILVDGKIVDHNSRSVLWWVVENSFWPATMRFHTANPVGHEWLLGTARNFAPETTEIDPTDPWAVKGFENYG